MQLLAPLHMANLAALPEGCVGSGSSSCVVAVSEEGHKVKMENTCVSWTRNEGNGNYFASVYCRDSQVY